MMWGCSDDDPAPTTTNVIVDEDRGIETLLDDVSGQVNTYLDTAVSIMAAGLRVATYTDIGGEYGSLYLGGGVADSTGEADVWIIAWVTDLQAGVGTMNLTDSITYVVNGQMGTIADGANDMYVRHHYTFVASDTTVTFTNVANHGDLHIAGIDGNTATINGTLSTSIHDKLVSTGSTTWNTWEIEASLSDIDVTKTSSAWTSGCPNSGSCTVVVDYTYAENLDMPMTTTWVYEVTFTDGTMDVDVSIGNLSASYEHDLCTIQ
jgi:hypothetical protein